MERRTAVAVYARELLRALHGDGAQASLELMVETRWQPLMSSFAAAAPPEDCSSNGEGSGAGEGVCAVDARGEATDAAATEPAFGCSASELPLDEAGQAHFNERVGEAAAALLPAADHDASHGRRTLSLLAWNRLEQLAMWAVGGGADGVQLFISKIPETCSK